jgi:hypothetical protein
VKLRRRLSCVALSDVVDGLKKGGVREAHHNPSDL